MQKCLLSTVLCFCFFSLELFSQHTPFDRCVRDSLTRLKPHESPAQNALIYLETAELIRSTMPEQAFGYTISAYKIAINEKNDTLKGRARMKMGDYYQDKRKFIQALEQYLAARKIFQWIHDTTGELTAIENIGIINRTLRNLEPAIDYFQKGNKLALQANKIAARADMLGLVATTYQLMGNRDSALHYFNRELALRKQLGNRSDELDVRNCIGTLLLDEEKYDEALVYYNLLLREADTTDNLLMGSLYTRIGHIFDKKQDYRTSLEYNLRALSQRRYAVSKEHHASSLINVAGDYYNLGKPDSGKIYMDSGLAIARQHDWKQYIENGYGHLYQYYKRIGAPRQALDCFRHYSEIQDDINRERYRNRLEILETNQRLQQITPLGDIYARNHNILSLNLSYNKYLRPIVKVMAGVATGFVLVFIFLLLLTRLDRRKMQELNVQLSHEISEREFTEAQTREREKQYKFITDNSIDFITHMDQDNNRIYASPASMTVYGYEPEEIIRKSSHDLTHPDDFPFTDAEFSKMRETRSSRQFIYKARKKNGANFWVESVLNPLFDPISGIYKGMVGVTRDIQDRKTKELAIMEGTKQKENLLKEIHHRVKNNFAILVSLINMQMAQTKNTELLQSLTNLQLRIRTMALVHEMLYRSSDFEKISFPGYLRSLASVIAGTYNRRDVALIVEADEVVMDIEASIPLGLMINEILSNAYKHAFPDGRPGKILIRYCTDQLSGVNTLLLEDDGIGFRDGVNIDHYKSMGLQVVQILCNQIEGTLVVANNPGASFSITFHTHKK